MDLRARLQEAALELGEDLGEMQPAPTKSQHRLINDGEADQGAAGLAGIDGHTHRISGLDLLAVKARLDHQAGGGTDLDDGAVGRHLVRTTEGISHHLRLRSHLGRHRKAEAVLLRIARQDRAAAAVDLVVDGRRLGRQR